MRLRSNHCRCLRRIHSMPCVLTRKTLVPHDVLFEAKSCLRPRLALLAAHGVGRVSATAPEAIGPMSVTKVVTPCHRTRDCPGKLLRPLGLRVRIPPSAEFFQRLFCALSSFSWVTPPHSATTSCGRLSFDLASCLIDSGHTSTSFA